jgi:hypothetical protein
VFETLRVSPFINFEVFGTIYPSSFDTKTEISHLDLIVPVVSDRLREH